MRQETNNEMDLLLRRLGRQQETSASSDHLDADELSSYAENVLPPAARARYTEHLAECVRCRDLVVQLSSSTGVVVAQESAKVSAPSALSKFLASLFSPMVLRYAVPALGLVVVAAIGFIVTRDQGSTNSPVAEVREQQPAQVPAPASQGQPSSSPEAKSYGVVDSIESANKAVP
ncbi:MAG TPA: zf-HC2 domain-containing protein, partial [Pyrinomonadaceae bacterium]|nr:zf-HC2 domain-containing protein [Pyrinomonadaceae bacterium]